MVRIEFELKNFHIAKFILSDVDECQTNDGGCNQTCYNTAGSFECSCGPGYALAADNLDCDGKNYFLFIRMYKSNCIPCRS